MSVPYRSPAPAPDPADPPKLAARIACFFAGHQWVAFKMHNLMMQHLHPTAGVDARCTRCGSVSMWGGQRYDEEP